MLVSAQQELFPGENTTNENEQKDIPAEGERLIRVPIDELGDKDESKA